MKVDIQEISAVKKALHVEVPLDVVARHFAQAYNDLNRRVRLPGFRPGKAPRSLLENRYGGAVVEDVVKSLVSEYYPQAVRQAGLQPVQFPSIDRVDVKEGAPFSFVATVEVRPTIVLGDFGSIEIHRRASTISEDEVEKTLAILADQNGELVAAPEEKKAAAGDYVIIDFAGTADGRPIENGRAEGFLVQIGSNSLLPDFENQLVGLARGAESKIRVTYPADSSNPKLAGKEAFFSVTVREIKEKKIPPIDDDLARDLGEESLGTLKEKIRARLIDQKRRDEERAQKNQAIDQMVKMHTFEIPASLVEHEVHAMVERIASRLAAEGIREPVDAEGLAKEYRPAAESRVRATFLLSAIAEREGLKVSDEEVEEEIRRSAQSVRIKPEEAKRVIVRQEGSLEGLRTRLCEEKAVALLLSKARYKDI